MLSLNIDDDFDFLKGMCCVSKGTHLSDVVETRSLCVKIMKELVPDDGTESQTCRNMERSILDQLKKRSN